MDEEQVVPKISHLHAQPYKEGGWEKVRVELSKEHLLVHRRDIVYEDTMANNYIADEKHTVLHRDEESRLGIAIMGGLDFKCPIKIYKLIEGTPAQMCGKLEEMDVILEVNGVAMWGLSHDEAVKIIKESGQEVVIHTGKMRCREIEDQVSIAEEWFVMSKIPLQMASLTKYQTGTSILRPNSFEVVSGDGGSRICLQCGDSVRGELEDWMSSIAALIAKHNKEETDRYNNNLDEDEKIVKMGWVYEQLPSTAHSHVWQRKLLVLRGDHIQIHHTFPEGVEGWERPERRHKLLEMTVKVLEPHTIPSQRAGSMLLTSGTGVTHIISCETKENIMDWTTAIHRATVATVNTTRQMRYAGRWKERDVDLVLDIANGILLCNRGNTSNVLWEKPFSYLLQSSDDGYSRLKLKCAIRRSKITETQDIELQDLQLAICGLECFVAAKLAELDPTFIQHHTDLIAY